ncbi:MAG: GAF domain-containing protein, partial [Anaerolineae bacterium]|nr:GAF domain-containing protein [Anaerolineae bacterium]
QSKEPAAFTEEDIAVLQTLADQVATAIYNAQLFQQVQASLEAERRAYGELSRKAWADLLRTRPELGFSRDRRGLFPVGEQWSQEMELAFRSGETVTAEGSAKVAIPVKIRGRVVGVIEAHRGGEAEGWTSEQITLLETLADQLGEALENARLYQEAQRRAVRERLTREITDRMRRAASIEGIIQTAVDELFGLLGPSRTFVRLTLPEEDERSDDGRVRLP